MPPRTSGLAFNYGAHFPTMNKEPNMTNESNSPDCDAMMHDSENTGLAISQACGKSVRSGGRRHEVAMTLPLSASLPVIHEKLVALIKEKLEAGAAPLTIFKDLRFESLEHLGLPGYMFDCDWECRFAYELGHKESYIVRERDNQGHYVDRERTKTVWEPERDTASGSDVFLVGASKEVPKITDTFWHRIDHTHLINDAGGQKLPSELDEFPFSIPIRMILEKKVTPRVASRANAVIHKQLSDQKTRNISPSTPKFTHSEEPIMIVVEKVSFANQGGKNTIFYVTGDGALADCDNLPQDADRQAEYKKAKEKSSGCACYVWYVLGTILCWGGAGAIRDGTPEAWWAVGVGGTLALLGGCMMLSGKKYKALKAYYDAEGANALVDFQKRGGHLQGFPLTDDDDDPGNAIRAKPNSSSLSQKQAKALSAGKPTSASVGSIIGVVIMIVITLVVTLAILAPKI